MVEVRYVAGVCNIGQEEIARRQRLGWVTLVITCATLGVFIWADISPWWWFFVFFPATMSASGFLQAYFSFCSGFARAGLFNFGSVGETSHVADESSRAKDKKTGNTITLYSILVGAVVAIISVVVGLLIN